MSECTTPWRVTNAESCTWFDRYRIVFNTHNACLAYESIFDDPGSDVESEFGASMDIVMLRELREIIDRAIETMEKAETATR